MTTKQVAVAALIGVVGAVITWFVLGAIMHGRMESRMMGEKSGMHGQMSAAPAGQTMPAGGAPAPHGAGHGQGGMGPMGTALTGDPDKDFAREMIVHHEIAVTMAKDVLAKGKDPEIRKLAEDVIAAQTKEIEFLRAWLDKQPK